MEERPFEDRETKKVAMCKPGREASEEFQCVHTLILDIQPPEL
jgi:hypothetical protein